MKQKHLEEELYDYLTGRLDKGKQRFAEGHLKECDRCRKELEELKKAITLVEQFQQPPLPADFKKTMMEKFRTMPLPKKSLHQRIKEWFQRPYVKWPGFAVAVVALLVLAINIQTSMKGIYEESKMARDVQLKLMEVKNPVIMEVDEVEKGIERLTVFVRSLNGEVLQELPVKGGFKVTIRLGKEKETALFNELSKMGKVHKEQEGYRDEGGHIVVILKKEEKR